MWLIVGLGNPGEEYARTRHNIGWRAVNEVARRHGLEFSGKRANARLAEGHIAGQRVVLARPQTYMNNSGHAVVGLLQWYKLDPQRELLVIYDDTDLPFGVLRLRERGSPGTHNGMRSVTGMLGTQHFPRLRIGIGQRPAGWDLARYVLGRFTPAEEEQLPALLTRVADAVDVILRDGLTAAMNRYNAPERPPKEKQPPPSEPEGPPKETQPPGEPEG
ncbi:MAG: aminoacyl-tRNA hydrolase [Chloroflexota bacterium]|nr:MAG: aminoacyl-tRNA hydrolase [Chloroflexota bacterium]